MGDSTIAQDMLDAVACLLGDLGDERTLRVITTSALDINNPGETPTETETDTPLDAFLFDFIQEYMPGANVIDGTIMAILSMDDLTSDQIALIKPGTRLVDSNGTTVYEIIKTNPTEVAGQVITIIVQLKA